MRIGRIGAALVNRVKAMFVTQREQHDARQERRDRRRAKRAAKAAVARKRRAHRGSAPRKSRRAGKLPKRIFGQGYGYRERYLSALTLDERIRKNVARLKLEALKREMKAQQKAAAS